MATPKRTPVTIRFRYNKESGEIEDFIIDDNTPNASEESHDKIADLIARQLGAKPDIEDAGPIRFGKTPEKRTDGAKAKEEDTPETLKR
jgi:hypothetical protein